jgi:hypothetical protein
MPVPFPGVTPAGNASALPGMKIMWKIMEAPVRPAVLMPVVFKIITKQGRFQP